MLRPLYLVAARTARGEEFLHETDFAKAGLADVATAIREGAYATARITAIYRCDLAARTITDDTRAVLAAVLEPYEHEGRKPPEELCDLFDAHLIVYPRRSAA
jgi:hypothetical protein